MGLISSIVICKSFSPRLRSGPIAASLAKSGDIRTRKSLSRITLVHALDAWTVKEGKGHTISELNKTIHVPFIKLMLLMTQQSLELTLPYVVLRERNILPPNEPPPGRFINSPRKVRRCQHKHTTSISLVFFRLLSPGSWPSLDPTIELGTRS